MSFNVARVATLYEKLQEEVEPLLFLARNRGLQTDAINQVDEFIRQVDQERLAAIIGQNEQAANSLLGLGEIGRALRYELAMYVLLKDDEAEQAWDALITAQDHVSGAARAYTGFTNLEAKFQHLREMESYFFPPQIFVSAGMIAGRQECTICRSDYEGCEHIAGQPYMGRFCSVNLQELRLDHAAIVDSPADRRCRVKTFGVPNGIRNRMTWAVTATPAEQASGDMSLIVATASEKRSSGSSQRDK